jgi:hypothetical protein
MPRDADVRWLLLIHQLPAKPAYARVKVWRRLQALGAVTVKGAVYALPANSETQEDFAWLAKEIVESGGEAMICEAALVEGFGDHEMQALFDQARDEDYARIATEAREIAARQTDEATDRDLAELTVQAGRLRKQLDAVVAIDFFGANGRLAAQGLVSGLEAALQGAEDMPSSETAPAPGPLANRTWVTRKGVQVDRIASAWLIRRFIDKAARFKFVPSSGYHPEPGELRFDMFEGEFTHRGDRCTFEVLKLTQVSSILLCAIGEIIHDIDLKDDNTAAPRPPDEEPDHRHRHAGRRRRARLARGAVLLDGSTILCDQEGQQ